MIPRSRGSWQVPAWQRSLNQAFTSADQLLRYLELEPSDFQGTQAAAGDFSLRVPLSYAARMQKGNADDPLLRQVIPVGAELAEQPGFITDPVGDLAAGAVPGVLQKYRGRALLVATGACAVHCRYCFRRHYPYAERLVRPAAWENLLEFLADNTEIEEIILSGGDPLLLDDAKLEELSTQLARIPHLRRLRLHTRLPIVLPDRVTGELNSWLQRSPLVPVMVVHCNHPNELSADVIEALKSVRDAGTTLLNQSVLLRGVNDSAQTLCDLSKRLFHAGVLPYYLHLLDRVKGAAHFEVPEPRARELHRAMRAALPGYLVPRLVREKAGESAKVPLPP